MDIKNKSAGTDATRGLSPEVPGCEKPKERRKSNPSGVREIQRLSRMMAVVVFLYYISWLPMLVSLSVRVKRIARTQPIISKANFPRVIRQANHLSPLVTKRFNVENIERKEKLVSRAFKLLGKKCTKETEGPG